MTSLNKLWRAFLAEETGLPLTKSTYTLEKSYWNGLAGTSNLQTDEARERALSSLGFPIENYGGARHDQLKAYWNSVVPDAGFMVAWKRALELGLIPSSSYPTAGLVFGGSALSGNKFLSSIGDQSRDVQPRYVNHLNGTTQAGLVPDDTTLDITNHLTVILVAKNDKSILTESENMAAKYDQGNSRRTWGFVQVAPQTFGLNLGDTDGFFAGRWESDISTTVHLKHCYACTFESGTVKLFLDGTEVSGSLIGADIPSVINTSTAPLTIGSALSNGSISRNFDGIIYELIIFKGDSTVLTQAQISDIVDSIKAKPTKDIQNTVYGLSGQSVRAHYKLDEQTGSTFFDSSGNENHGIWQNSPTVETRTENVINYQNQVGYTNNAGDFIPRDESDITNDVQGNPLGFSGKVAYNAKLEGSSAIALNGTTQYGVLYDGEQVPTNFQSWGEDIVVEARIKADGFANASPSNWSSDNTLFELRQEATTGCKVPISLGFVNAKIALGVSSNYTADSEVVEGNTTLNTSVEYRIKAVISGDDYELYYAIEDGDWILDGAGTFVTATGTRNVGTVISNMSVGVRAKDNGDRISNFFDGLIYDLKVGTSSEWYINTPISEGAGDTSYDISGNEYNTTWVGSPSWSTQNTFHNNITEGFNRYTYFVGSSGNSFFTDDPVNETLFSIKADFYTPVNLDKNSPSISFFDGSQTANVFGFNLGPSTGLLTDEVITIIAPSSRRTAVQNITISKGWHTLEISWNAGEGRYDIILDDVVQTVVSSGVGHALQYTACNRIRFGRYGSLTEFEGIIANMVVKSDASTEIFNLTGYNKDNPIDTASGYTVSSVNLTDIRIPKISSANTDVFGETLRNPAVVGHNDAETTIDFKNIGEGGFAIPETAYLASSTDFTAFSLDADTGWDSYDYAFYRQNSSTDNDRFLIYDADLTGDDLTNAKTYTGNN